MNILILGRAKTGTTIIARTLQASLENATLLMEPKTLVKFAETMDGDVVAKLIFEHWQGRDYSRLAVINNEMPLAFDRHIFIVRDPRDELISRMFYVPYGYIKEGRINREQLQPWLELVERKEKSPDSVSVLSLLNALSTCLDVPMSLMMEDTFKYFEFLRKNARMGFLLRYEDFMGNQITDLENYLGMVLTSGREVGARFDRTRRTSGYNNWKTFFLPEDMALFKSLHEHDMAAMAYVDWELAPVAALNPEHGSLYLERLLDEAERRRSAVSTHTAVGT